MFFQSIPERKKVLLLIQDSELAFSANIIKKELIGSRISPGKKKFL